MVTGPHGQRPIRSFGRSVEDASAAMVLLHGRGGTAEGILEIARVLDRPDFAALAPEATDNSWYPYSFLAPRRRNEPGLSSALQVIEELVASVTDRGIPADRIVIGGFSQGACLAAEFVARNPRRYGGLLVFSGGLIGPLGAVLEQPGSLEGTPVFLGCSDRDAHIPLERVEESAEALASMGANVVKRIYPDMGHTIIEDEIDHARSILDDVLPGEVTPPR